MENYGTMEKKLWYYGQNYGTITRTMELCFFEGKKNIVDYQKLKYFNDL